jgi:hypothetical protein
MADSPTIDLPGMPGPARGWRGILIEAFQSNGIEVFGVTSRTGLRPAQRRWFADPATAFAHALEIAEAHKLPLLDLRDGGAE